MDKKENPICEEKMPETLYRIGMFAGMNHVIKKILDGTPEKQLLMRKQNKSYWNLRRLQRS